MIKIARKKRVAEDLVRSYFDWWSRYEKAQPLGCDLVGKPKGSCCKTHRKLWKELQRLERKARSFGDISKGNVLSPRWIEDLAKKYDFEIPKNRPIWY